VLSVPTAWSRQRLAFSDGLLVHGGLWARDTWALSSTHQWLANRGYAVLSVNFRGSTGLGKAFVNAANLEWAANRSSFTAVVEAFLAAHLGGRFEPVGGDFADSTIEFRAGRELIPGLT
jgi:hypothetical protein